VSLLECRFCLGLTGTGHFAACLRGLVARLNFVEFLRADRLLFKKSLVAFEGRFGEREVGFRRRYFLLGCQIGRRGAV
jgi:hypothetical protein